MRRDDDLISRSDARRAKSQGERGCAGCDADAVLNATIPSELFLEALHLFAEDEAASREDTIEGGAKVLHQIVVVAGQADERNVCAIRG